MKYISYLSQKHFNMEHKKEIGELFKDKLSTGKKKPSLNLWEKINSTLEAEKLRKKRLLYRWLVGTGLVGALLLFLALNNESPVQKNSEKQQNEVPLTNHSNNSIESFTEKAKEDNDAKQSFETSEVEPLMVTNENENENEKPANIKSKIQHHHSEKNSKNNNSVGTFDESLIVTKNYHYYDSRSNKTLVTQNKSFIDSIINVQSKSLDSVKAPKANTVGQ